MERRLQSATNRPRLTAILTAVGLTVAIAAVPASAGAAVRTGSVQDPQGDASALSGPVLDLKSVAVRCDDVAGTLRVSWTYYDDVRLAFGQYPTFYGQFGAEAPVGLDWANVSWSGSRAGDGSPSISTNLGVSGAGGSLSSSGSLSDDGHVVTAEFTNALLAGHDWQQSLGIASSGDAYDTFWFDGYSAPHVPPANFPTVNLTPVNVPAPGASDDRTGMTINDGAQYTNDPNVTLSVVPPSYVGNAAGDPNWSPDRYRVANDGGFRNGKVFPPRSAIPWKLAESGAERLPKTVYFEFGSQWGWDRPITDDIILDQTKPIVSSASVDSGGTATTAAVVQAAASETRTYRVHIRAKDATSGVAKVQFARNKQHPSSLHKFTRTTRYKATRAPKYLRVQDRAGNFSRWRSVRY